MVRHILRGHIMLERLFKLSAAGTNVKREVLAGVTTFLTMAYIVFLQPFILSGAGMDFDAVLFATCISAAIATLVMGLLANLPIAQAPGMGENYFFVGICASAGGPVAMAAKQAGVEPWRIALGIVFVSGIAFLILSLGGARRLIVDQISTSMKHAIAVGIGLFIAFIGLKNAGLITSGAVVIDGKFIDPGTLVRLSADFANPDIIIFFIGLILTAVLLARRVPGAILLGIVGATVFAIVGRLIVDLPALADAAVVQQSKLATMFHPWSFQWKAPSVMPTLLKMDLVHIWSLSLLPYMVIFLVMDVFDTTGTIIGVASRAGLITEDGQLPGGNRALVSDAIGTCVGAALGTSTVTSYIESTAGVEQGGRTGLVSVVVAICFLLALLLQPIVSIVGGYPVLTAPTLVVIGALMFVSAHHITWDDPTEAVPAFLMMIGIPLTFSIADGLALGFVAYPLVKLISGRLREVNWFMIVLCLLFVAYFLFVRPQV